MSFAVSCKAFPSAELSYSKVRALTRVADETNEEQLLNFALHVSASQVERLVMQYRRAGYLQIEDNAYRQYLERDVWYYYDADGSVVMKVRLPTEQGEMFIKAMEKMMEADIPTGVRSGGQMPEQWADDEPMRWRTSPIII